MRKQIFDFRGTRQLISGEQGNMHPLGGPQLFICASGGFTGLDRDAHVDCSKLEC